MTFMLHRRSVLAGLATIAAGVAAPAMAQEALEAIKRNGKLTVGIHNRRPWGFRTAEGEVAGFHPDLVRAAFTPLGVNEIDFVVTEFGALIPGLMARRFDMIASGIAITPERCSQVIFSEPDLSVGDAVLVLKGNPKGIQSFTDITNHEDFILGGARGTLNTKDAIDAGVPEDRMMQFPSGNETLSALIAGRVDGSVMSGPTATMMLEDPNLKGKVERVVPFEGLIREDGTPAALYTAIAFRPEDEALRDAYDERLAELKADGTVDQMRTRYGFTDDEAAPGFSTDQICKGL